jgi:hypothetical protein
MARKHKKLFACGHKGYGKICHRCEDERRAKESKTVEREQKKLEKQQWKETFGGDPIDLTGLMPNLVMKARNIIHSEHLRLLTKDVLLEIVHTDQEFVQQREFDENSFPGLSDERIGGSGYESMGILAAVELTLQQLVEELREELERPTPESSDPHESFDAFSIVGLFSAEPDFAERSEEMLHAQFDLGQ